MIPSSARIRKFVTPVDFLEKAAAGEVSRAPHRRTEVASAPRPGTLSTLASLASPAKDMYLRQGLLCSFTSFSFPLSMLRVALRTKLHGEESCIALNHKVINYDGESRSVVIARCFLPFSHFRHCTSISFTSTSTSASFLPSTSTKPYDANKFFVYSIGPRASSRHNVDLHH